MPTGAMSWHLPISSKSAVHGCIEMLHVAWWGGHLCMSDEDPGAI